MTSRLSIVIPSHSRADLLRRCLTSVARHSPPNTEILVVDDGSPAQAVSCAATYLARARVIRFSRRAGFCAAVNAGIEGGVAVEKVRNMTGAMGLNAATGEYEDLVKAGIIDAAKVTRSALQNAASIAALFLTTEVVIADAPEKKAGAGGGGGMGDMDF